MGDNLKINTDAVVKTADAMSSFKKDLVNLRSSTDKEISQLDNVWDSPGASKMINVYNKLKKEACNNVQQVFTNYINFLNQQISDGYIAVEDYNKTLADQFK